MEVPSWAITDTIAVCTHVQRCGNSDWDSIATALHKSPALCALKWHVLYLAHQSEKLKNLLKIRWTDYDWELAVLLRGCPDPDKTTFSQRTHHKELAEWLPGRTDNGVKQAVKTHIKPHERQVAAGLAGYPATLRGVLEAWPGPRPELQKVQDTLLPERIVAAEILAQLVPSKDAAALPAAEPSSALNISADLEVPTAEGSTLVFSPATEAGSSSTSLASHVTGLSNGALQSAVLFAPECNNCSGSTQTVTYSTASNASLFPFGVFGTGGCSSTSSSPTSTPVPGTSHLGQGFSSPVAGGAVDVGAFGVDLGSSQLQPFNAISNTTNNNCKRPCSDTTRLSSNSDSSSSTVANLGHAFLLPGAGAADVGSFVGDWRSTPTMPQPFSVIGCTGVSNHSGPSNSATADSEYGSSLPAALAAVDVDAWVVNFGTLPVPLQPAAASSNWPSSSYSVGHSLWSPLAGAASDVDAHFWTPSEQCQPVVAPNKAQSSRSKRSGAATVSSGSKAAMRHSKPTKDLHSKQQQRTVVRKRKALGGSVDTELAPYPAAEVGSQQQPAKSQCGSRRSRVQASRVPAVVPQQQQYMPLELQYTMQSWQNQATSLQLQCPATPPVSGTSFQATGAVTQPLSPMESEAGAFVHDCLTTEAAASSDCNLQPPDFTAVQCNVPSALPAPTHCDMEKVLTAAAAMQMAPPQETGSDGELDLLLDQLLGVTPEQPAGHYAALAAPDAAPDHAHAPGQQSWQQQQDALNASAAAQVAAGNVFGCFTEGDLATAIHELPAAHQADAAAPAAAAAESASVQGNQLWQQHGASITSAGGLVVQGAADGMLEISTEEYVAAMLELCPEPQALEPQHQCQQQPSTGHSGVYVYPDAAGELLQYVFEGDQLATLASLVAVNCFSADSFDIVMEEA